MVISVLTTFHNFNCMSDCIQQRMINSIKVTVILVRICKIIIIIIIIINGF